MKTDTEENRQFRILSALGIIFVVAGHLGYGVFDLGGVFPYYSFHVYIFLFVSGYFYKDEAEKNIGRHIYLYSPGMGKSNALCHFLRGKIFCLGPKPEGLSADIHRIRSEDHRRFQHLKAAGGNQQLRFLSLCHHVLPYLPDRML